jgi:hypothetical protein
MRGHLLLDAILLLTLGACSGQAQQAQPAQPAQATAAIMVRDGESILLGIAPYNPHKDNAPSAPADKDGYAWEVRDAANEVVRKGRLAKTVTWRSEWDAAGKPDPREMELPALWLEVVVPNIGGSLVIYDAPAGDDTGPQLATLRLPVVPAGAVVCVMSMGTLDCNP